jgi:hypothetical protein
MTTISKIKNLHANFFAKNKPVELTDHKAGLFYATSMDVSSQISEEVSGSKGGKRKFQDICFHGSFMIPVTTFIV